MTKSFTTVAAVHRVLVALTDFVSSLNNITHHSNVDLYRHSLFFFWKRNFNELGRTSPNSKLGYYVKRSFFLLFFFVFFFYRRLPPWTPWLQIGRPETDPGAYRLNRLR